MGYQVLSRKWRPKKFEDVIGQEHITRSLANTLKRGTTGPAYLFTGTRGVGKTSVARIFAKSIRCENLGEDGQSCEKCPSCLSFGDNQSLDVIEIDGASNNSVDNIRELINNVQFLPSSGKKRVYIIDEVHMLSTSAFNALLKTLEEPPAHVLFIFATTEPDRILDTVLSRCLRFDFRSPSLEKLKLLIKKIAKEETINFQNEKIIEKICFFGNGSVRDSLSILDQLLTFSEDNNITEETLSLGLGLAKQESLYDLTASILSGDVDGMRTLFREMQAENVSPEKIYHGVIDTIYELVNSFMGGEIDYPHSLEQYGPQELMWIYETLSKDLDWAQKTFDLGKTMEIIFHKVCLRREQFGESQQVQKKKVEPRATKPKIKETVPTMEPVAEPFSEPEPKPASAVEVKKSWVGFLNHLHETSLTIGEYLEQGNITKEPMINSGKLSIVFGFPASSKVYHEYISQPDVRKKLLVELSNYYGVGEDKIELELDLKIKEEKFRSVANLKDEEIQEAIKKKEKNLLEDPQIKLAENLFNSKVDKVVVTKKI